MNRIYKLSCLLFLVILFKTISVEGSDMLGGEITWKCLSRDVYLIKVIYLRDCNGVPSSSSLNVSFKSASNGTAITSLTLSPGAAVDITPTCATNCTRCSNSGCTFPYGIQKYEYQGIVDLSIAGSYCNIVISFSYCCRSETITTGAAWENIYTEAMLNRCISPCDNSPEFSNNPTVICVGQDYMYNSQPNDPDIDSAGKNLDSFAFEFVAPLSGPTTANSWKSGYSFDKPVYFWGFPNSILPFPRGIHIDAVTGNISFRPMNIEETIMTLKVSEFRHGVKIGEIRREMSFLVMACPGNNLPTISSNSYYKEVCAGDTVSFTINSNDNDTANSVVISYYGKIPGAVFTENNGLVKHPTGVFTWIPTESQVSNSLYNFNVSVVDNACPLTGQKTHIFQILVKPHPKAGITVSNSCGNISFSANPLSSGNPSYTWESSVSPDNFKIVANSFVYRFSKPAVYPFRMTMTTNNCSTIYEDSVIVDTFLQAILPADTQLCRNSVIRIPALWTGNRGTVKFQWSSSATDTLDYLQLKVTKDTIITLSISDNTHCSTQDNIKIKVFPLPNVNAGFDKKICFGDSVFLSAKGALKYWWNNGDSVSDIRIKPLKTSDYFVTGQNKDGCKQTDTVKVIVFPYLRIEAGKNQQICPGEKTWLHANGGNTYLWNTGEKTDSIEVSPLVTSMYFVWPTDTNSCNLSDSVLVTVNAPAFAEAGVDTGICNGHLIKLTASGGTKYLWSTGDSTASTSFIASYAGFQYVTVWNSFGCQKTDSVFVDIYPVPLAKFSASPVSGKIPLTVNFYDSSSVSSGSIVEYYWDFDNSNYSSVKNPVFIFNDSGTFDIRLTVKTDKGCTKSVLKQKLVNTTKVSIAENLKESEIEIIPNPAKDFVIIRVKSGYLKSFSLINSEGKTILTRQDVNSKEIIIRRPENGKGIYLLQLYTCKNSIYNRKIIFE